jgi:TolA-binding protein
LSVAERLASARRSLAKGSAAEAEKLAQSVLGLHPSARDAAEARTLLAECAVARGNSGRAISLYLDVARAYSTLPAGDNALFAAARLSERSGGSARAHELFEQYLRQYPAGRFRHEAERHLRPVSTSPSTTPG